jgi:predicted dehydrogenase
VKELYKKGIARNIFVEKTLASNSEEARQLCSLTEKVGGVNMVGYLRRFSVTFMKAMEFLERGIVGEPVSFRAYAYSSDFSELMATRRLKTPSVGVVRDLGCHALDLALWFFRDFKVEDARVESVVNDESMDSAHFNVKTLNNVVGEFDVSWCVDGYRVPEVGFIIEGSKGSLSVNDDKLTVSLKDGTRRKWLRHDLGDRVGFWLGSPEYYREDEHFVKAVLRGESVQPCFETAAKVDCLIDEVLAKAG